MVAKKPASSSSFLLEDVSWEAYEKVLAAFQDRRLPHTYCAGILEFMTLTQEHEWIKKLLARFIENISIELHVRLTSSGSTTLKRELQQRGVEPDESYYVAHYAAVRGLKRINLEKHPPPDLVAEVDATNKSLDRLETYAKIGVPEIWHHDHQGLRFLKRASSASYRVVKQSVAFPQISSEAIQKFLHLRSTRDEYDLLNDFIAWLRTL